MFLVFAWKKQFLTKIFIYINSSLFFFFNCRGKNVALNLSLYQCYSSEAIEILYCRKYYFQGCPRIFSFSILSDQDSLSPRLWFPDFPQATFATEPSHKAQLLSFRCQFWPVLPWDWPMHWQYMQIVVRSLIDELHKDSSVGLREAMAPA